MLNKLRNFSKGKLAGVLVGIIIIPFVFWGMGSVFSGGNTNSIAKINNHNVSTQDFADFVNNSKISSEVIKENIDNNVLEELLKQLVSITLINLEIDELEVFISDNNLATKIKKKKNFQDENNNFSRTKYEKFLLENNMSSIEFEKGIKDNELKKKLFKYISGGIKSPFFLVNKTYKENFKKIEIDYINLNKSYIDKNKITINDVKKYIEKNEEKFLVEKVDLSIVKISPEIISGEKEFTETFFSKIDEIEDLISNKVNIDEISKKYSLKIETYKEYYPGKIDNKLLDEIYKKKDTSVTDIIDKNDFFLLYEITNPKKILPNINDTNFLKMAKNDLYQMSKYDLHKELMMKIQKKKFNDEDFSKLAKNNFINLKINSIEDTKQFTADSIKLLYSLAIDDYSLISDKNNNVYLVRLKNIDENNLIKNSDEKIILSNQTNSELRDMLYNSYDFLLNEKYNIEVNEKTLERMKNYFR